MKKLISKQLSYGLIINKKIKKKLQPTWN